MTEPLLTEEVILARFHRLRITINLSATRFGYVSLGRPSLIKQIEGGMKLHAKSKRRLAACLDELERQHSIPLNVNGKRTVLDGEENIPIIDPNQTSMEE